MRIMFSRIIPLEEEPRQHALWVMAERFGATCTAHMGDDVTHLVTNTQHTLKVSRSKRMAGKMQRMSQAGRRRSCISHVQHKCVRVMYMCGAFCGLALLFCTLRQRCHHQRHNSTMLIINAESPCAVHHVAPMP